MAAQMTLNLAPATQDPPGGPTGPPRGQERPSRGFPVEACARPGCLAPVPPQSRGGDPRRYCSDSCQRADYERRRPRVPPKRKGGPTRAEQVLARLKLGPATGIELLAAGGGTRYGARIAELRASGVVVLGPLPWRRPDGSICNVTTKPTPDGFDVYELSGE